MLSRLAMISARLPAVDDAALLDAALADRRMQQLALSVVPMTKRDRGRPRKRPVTDGGAAVLAEAGVPVKASPEPRPIDPAQVEAEITEAVVRYRLTRR
jgi:hypothetical protein